MLQVQFQNSFLTLETAVKAEVGNFYKNVF